MKIGIMGLTGLSSIAALWARRVAPRASITLFMHGDGVIYDAVPEYLAGRSNDACLTLASGFILGVALRLRLIREGNNVRDFDKVGVEISWRRKLIISGEGLFERIYLDEVEGLKALRTLLKGVDRVDLRGPLPEAALLAQGLLDAGVKITCLEMYNIADYFDPDMRALMFKLLEKSGVGIREKNKRDYLFEIRRELPRPVTSTINIMGYKKVLVFGDLVKDRELLTGRAKFFDDLGLNYRRALIAGLKLGGVNLKVKGFPNRLFFRIGNLAALSLGSTSSTLRGLGTKVSTRISVQGRGGKRTIIKLISDRISRRLLGAQVIVHGAGELYSGLELAFHQGSTLDELIYELLFVEGTYPLLRGVLSNAIEALWVKAGIPQLKGDIT